MCSLLESRERHRRTRILSRKLRDSAETELAEREHPRRKLRRKPTSSTIVTNRQREQRRRQNAAQTVTNTRRRQRLLTRRSPSHSSVSNSDTENEEPTVRPVTNSYLARSPLLAPMQRHNVGHMDVLCPFCRAHHWFAEKVTNSPSDRPEFTTCCQRGQVHIRRQSEPPPYLRTNLDSSDPSAKLFRNSIRQYNMSLAFTSLGVNEDTSVNRRGGWVFRVQGELSHAIGSLLPNGTNRIAYAQLYIFEPEQALALRMKENSNLNHATMESLQSMLLQSHRYSHEFLHAFEILNDFSDIPDATVRLRVMPGQDERRYNLPSTDEVAVILPGDGTAPERRDIVLRSRADRNYLARMDDGHPAYCPLHYVLLFPNGDHGWHRDMYHRVRPGSTRPPTWNAPRISQTEYSSFRLHTHDAEYSTIHRGGHLFQQFIVDMWASADQTRLAYLRFNQGRLRATLYSGLEDWLRVDEIQNPEELGTRAVLPSSYIGGPRHQQQRFQDAMAIARFYKKIDLFITMTANPKWDEITDALLPGQTSYDRPDIVARVFKLKKQELLDDIFKQHIFGRAVAYVYVIEFQKRGLPHLHLLVVLDHDCQLRTPADIDSCISAQWPDPQTHPLLFETVKSTMIHGPCGNINPSSPCMKNGQCTKGYPKPFHHSTSTNEDGYPLYARPDDGRSFPVSVSGVGSVRIDNTWIVPYNPYLSTKYNCHTNVESVATFRTVKYCFKYIHKGPDRATLEYERDEIKHFIDGRYIGPPEGVWRILHFDIHKQIPSIERLQVHLPGQHMVLFDPDEPMGSILARAAAERTTLTQFFHMNSLDNELGQLARNTTYQDFPHFFVWHKDTKTWSKRQQGRSLGRMYFVPPTGGERFYLRTLLTVVRGSKSFKDLRTFEDIEYTTFQDACRARGLLEDDGEWRRCLTEAAQIHPGSSLRILFASMLLFCQLSSPELLWFEFQDAICDDLLLRVPNPTVDRLRDYGLFLIDRIVGESGYTLQHFPKMPVPVENWTRLTGNFLITEQLNYDSENELQSFQQHMEQLQKIPDQLDAFQRVIGAVLASAGGVFFLCGPGGTGKTFVYNTICHRLRTDGKVVLCVASSGVAALLLPGGRTAHSTFRIPIDNLDADSLCNISKQDKRAQLLRAVDLIIWDEAPMQSRYAHEALDRTLRDICNNDSLPFGGKTVVLGGDFQQILPVLPMSSQEDVIDICLPRSYLWEHIQLLPLRTNMRLSRSTPEEVEFATWLLSVGHGTNLSHDGTVPFNHDMQVPDRDTLVNETYPNLGNVIPPSHYFLDRIILAPTNSEVNDLNTCILDRFPGQDSTFYSVDTVETDPGVNWDTDYIPPEYLRSLNASGLPPGELHLKPGCPLILLRNLAPSRGLCNGTRLILQHATPRVLEVKILGGRHNDEVTFIPRISLIPSSQPGMTFKLRRRQFPVCLAFALTINKAQGQTVRHVGIALTEPVFSHGQLYVALSRATSRYRVKLLLPPSTSEPRLRNVVYPEIFQMLRGAN